MLYCGMCQSSSPTLERAEAKAAKAALAVAEEAELLIAVQRGLVEQLSSLGLDTIAEPAGSQRTLKPGAEDTSQDTDCDHAPQPADWKSEVERMQEVQETRRKERDATVTRQLLEAQAKVEKRAVVRNWLHDEGFDCTNVNSWRRKLFRTTYPLHVASKCANEKLVELLIEEGADKNQKDSRGRTPAQVARQRDRHGSHAGVLCALSERPVCEGSPAEAPADKLPAGAPAVSRQEQAAAGGA